MKHKAALCSADPAPGEELAEAAMERYRFAPLVRFSLGPAGELLYSTDRDEVLELAATKYEIACSCSSAQTLSAHSRRVASTFHIPEPQALALLKELASCGVLASDSDLLRAPAEYSTPRQSIRTIAVPTSGRPAQLGRCLASYIDNTRAHGRDVEFLVVDGAGKRDEVCGLLTALAREFETTVYYLGNEEKRSFDAELVRTSGIPQHVADFALYGDERCAHRAGANRNAILLDQAGEMFFSVDDDTVCAVVDAPAVQAAPSLAMQSSDTAEYWFYADRGEALRSTHFSQADVLGRHEEFLGRDINTIAAEHASRGRVEMDTACGHILLGLQQGRGTVVATYNGLLGDSGMYWAGVLLLCPAGGTRERLLRSQTAYRRAVESKELLRLSPIPAITHGGSSMSTFMGLDHRELLPPFLSVQRAQDDLFGHTLRHCVPNGFFGHLPFALLHVPPGARQYGCDVATPDGRPELCELIAACIENCPVPPRHWETRDKLVYFGKHLVEMGSLPEDELGEYLHGVLRNRAGQRIAELEELIDRFHGQPRFWAADVRRQIESMAATIHGSPAARDLPGPPGCALGFTSELISRFGEVCMYWPEIVAAARSLRASGRRISTRVS